MAKVVLVWNEHPTEVVAGFHARKVARILQEKYGHEVVVEKIPARKTTYGILSKITDPKLAARRLLKTQPSIPIARNFARRHGAFTFNFHASPEDAFSDWAAPPEKFSTRFKRKFTVDPIKLKLFPSPITFIGTKKHFVVEVPGSKMKVKAIDLEKNERVQKELLARGKFQGSVIFAPNLHAKNLQLHLRDIESNLIGERRTKWGQRFYSNAISEKIAAAIHERITRK